MKPKFGVWRKPFKKRPKKIKRNTWDMILDARPCKTRLTNAIKKWDRYKNTRIGAIHDAIEKEGYVPDLEVTEQADRWYVDYNGAPQVA
ncbi:hypothetical protein A2U01_0057829 [Trifolium medium]|uniref:Uncharacterized protein n=1 Tax=Trifolium medium TaxID=97028 RepID=A0A392RM43_9FABA|nr:hypothetical protein [Trifolium medium]